MSEAYRIPRRQVVAQVTLVGEPPRDLLLFVGLHAQSHDGFERPSDLLNGRDTYVPARDVQGITRLLNLDAVLVATVGAREEYVLGGLLEFQTADASSLDVAVALEGGLRLNGTVRYVLPAGQQRLQNYLQQPVRFLSLYEGTRVHLINRRRIVWMECPRDGEAESAVDSANASMLPRT